MNTPVRILVVDDDPEILYGTCRALENAGYQPTAAHSGSYALRQIYETLPDLVLLDLAMPELSGIDLCRRIKTDAALADVFVLARSQAATEALANQADAVLHPTIGNRELIARIETHLRARRTERALRDQMDILRQRNAELLMELEREALSEARLQLASSTFGRAIEGVAVLDASGRILAVNKTFTQITGVAEADALGAAANMFTASERARTRIRRALAARGKWYGEVISQRKTGEPFTAMLTVSSVRRDRSATQRYVALFADITPIKQRQREELLRMERYDLLTGLANRIQFVEMLEQTLAQPDPRFAIAHIDLDQFRSINEQYGLRSADRLLEALARRLEDLLGPDDRIARLGGDEFIMLLANASSHRDLCAAVERFHDAIRLPWQDGAATLRVTASIGVVEYTSNLSGVDELLNLADRAMIQAKHAGKDRIHVYDPLRDSAAQTIEAHTGRINSGVDDGEFVLHYQPKINMRSGQLIGLEALLRWQHPERGLLRPGQFLGQLRDPETDLKLGDWVLDSAITQMAAWREHGIEIPISINVSARQLQSPDFAQRVKQHLANFPSLNPASLEIEIHEANAMENVSRVSEHIRACRELGVRFSLDDFGTAYAPLTCLKHLPVEVLKIDQSFIRDALDNTDSLATIQSVIGLAAAYRRQVIAEGVESEAQGTALLQMGCELAQGNEIAQPMWANDVPAWIGARQTPLAWTACSTGLNQQDRLVLLFAEVEHRQWMRSLREMLELRSTSQPHAIPFSCRLGTWLATHRQRKSNPRLERLIAMHDQLHRLGDPLLGRSRAVAESTLLDMEDLLNHLLDTLHKLSRADINPPRPPRMTQPASTRIH